MNTTAIIDQLTGRALQRTLVMGILNVTPDSFSDGGRYARVEDAVAVALAMVEAGADIIDVGGESTRPGHVPVSIDDERRRVLPVIEQLAPQCAVPISIDTTKSAIAREALAAGASIINDQWGLQGDPDMARVAAERRVPVVAMHNQRGASYTDLVRDVVAFLDKSLARADAAGLGRDRVIVDPGFGFGKTAAQNIELLRRLHELTVLDRPILIGTSRKSMIGHILSTTTPAERDDGTAATVAIGIAFGASIVRVHDVRRMVHVARMADAIVRAPHAEAGVS